MLIAENIGNPFVDFPTTPPMPFCMTFGLSGLKLQSKAGALRVLHPPPAVFIAPMLWGLDKTNAVYTIHESTITYRIHTGKEY